MSVQLAKRWSTFWFAPASPLNLGVCRVLFYGALLVFYIRYDYSELAHLPPELWRPISFFRTFGLEAPSGATILTFQWLWRATLLLSCLGVATRVCTAASFVLGIYLIALPHNFARASHTDAVVVLTLAVMAMSHCGDAFSVDSWRRRRRATVDAAQPSGEYTWPVRAVWLVICLAFFAAGVAKLRASGLAWITSDQFSNLMLLATVDHAALTTFGQVLGRYPRICSVLAGAAVVLEISAPLAVVSRRARLVIVPSLLAMLVGIRLLLGPSFIEFGICALFFVPWDRAFADDRALT